MPTYYSQDGEDAVMWALFDEGYRGYFVEVGALDGMRLSNCYSFELAGWRGVCIEPHEDYFHLVQRNRPGSICVRAAVSDIDAGEVEFYANARGTLSTLEPQLESVWRERYGKYFSGFQVQRVPRRTLTSILAEAGAPTPIDVVSIDVEGHELAVLRGLDLARYRPRVLVVEALDKERGGQLETFMRDRGYALARRIRSNLLFCRDAADVPVIASAHHDVPRIWTPHPLDAGVETGRQREARRNGRRARPHGREDRPPSLLARLKRRLLPGDAGASAARREERQCRRAARQQAKLARKAISVEAGFHGDAFLLQLVAHLADRCHAFIETGCNVGSTAAYVARTHPHLRIYSCEASESSYRMAARRLADFPQVELRQQLSPQFLHDLFAREPALKDQLNLYWLDAHGYGFRWPLKEEIAFLTRTLERGFILIDDFRVPGRPEFAFDQSEEQVCAIESIRADLHPRHRYTLIYPAYSRRTSEHHPLTGVGLIVFGVEGFALPSDLAAHFTVTTP